jgi:hypothetical protein
LAITTGQTTVGLTPTLIDGTSNSDFRLWIHNADNSQKVFLGGSNVTVGTGFGLEKLETIQLEMYPLDEVYAISAQAGHIIHFMKQV